MSSRILRMIGKLGRWALWLLMGIFTLWTFGAVYFNGPFSERAGNLVLAVFWLAVIGFLMWRIKSSLYKYGAWLGLHAVVLVPWAMISPSNNREWQQDWRETCWADISGDKIVIHNFRNFDYAKDGSVTERWESKTVHLSNLKGIDYFHVAFGGEWIAHSMLSFDFGVDGRVVQSIETRREVGESYSELGGLYKMFELQYLFGSEEDLVRVRTNVRDEPVYLYHLSMGKEAMRETFLHSVDALDGLKEKPRWYHLVTANCTTSLRAQTPKKERKKYDYRLLLNGKMDELLFERGGLDTKGMTFPELRKSSLVNTLAQESHNASNFSKAIRGN